MSDPSSKRYGVPGRPADGERTSSPTQALDALLSGAAADPIRRALWLDELDRLLQPLLPPGLAPHARLANVDGRKLVFLVDSPVWNARLRMASQGLVDAARSVGLDVADVVVRTTSRPLRAAIKASTPARQAGTPGTAGEHLRQIRASLHASPKGGTGQDGTDPATGGGEPDDPLRTGHPTGPKRAGS
ncbi:MAG: DUF721 domain-containing protein [Luteimonas sp.]|nr:DUF721 domain-containing protein [Luteimonas sp.]